MTVSYTHLDVYKRQGIDTAAIGAFFLNMSKDDSGVYHANFDCWQWIGGYNDFYNFMFDIRTSMKNAKYPFTYNGTSCILSVSYTHLDVYKRQVEFVWLAEEISEDTVSNRMEWELALREAMKQLKFRIINQENSFELFDDAGKRLYFGSDCRSAAERALMKILFPLNFQ